MAQHASICALRCTLLVDVSQAQIDTHPSPPASAAGGQHARDELAHCHRANLSLAASASWPAATRGTVANARKVARLSRASLKRTKKPPGCTRLKLRLELTEGISYLCVALKMKSRFHGIHGL